MIRFAYFPIAGNGSLAGYGAAPRLASKLWLLGLEGLPS